MAIPLGCRIDRCRRLPLFLLLTEARVNSDRRIPWRGGFVLAGSFAIPILGWFGFLLFDRGWTGLSFFVRESIKGAIELRRATAIPLPPFNGGDLLSPASTVVLAYWFVPAIYLICGLLWLGVELSGHSDRRSKLLLAVALIGASTFHQCLHRKGAAHLLQVIPPSIIGVCVVTAMICDYVSRTSLPAIRSRAVRFVGAVFFLVFMVTGLGLLPSGRFDLSEFQLRPRQKLRGARHILWTPRGAGRCAMRCASSARSPIVMIPSWFFRSIASILRSSIGPRAAGSPCSSRAFSIRVSKLRRTSTRSGDRCRDSSWYRPPPPGPIRRRPIPFIQDSAKSHAYLAQFIEENYPRKLHVSEHCVVLAPAEANRSQKLASRLSSLPAAGR